MAVDAGMQAPPTVDHLVYTIRKTDKMDALRTLLDRRYENAPIIVFGKTKHGVKKLASTSVRWATRRGAPRKSEPDRT